MTNNKQISPFVDKGIDFLWDQRGGAIVVGFVLVCTVLSASLGATNFSSQTVDDFSPTKSLPSFVDYNAFLNEFPAFLVEDVEVVLIQPKNPTTTTNHSIINPTTRQICASLEQTFQKHNSPAIKSLSSYFTFQNTTLHKLSSSYLNQDETATIFVLNLDMRFGASDFISTAAMSDTSAVAAEFPEYSLVLTGKLTTQQLSQEKTGKGFALTDGVGLPVIGLIFWWEVGSARLLTIPLAALGCSLMLSWGVGYCLTNYNNAKVPSYQPNIMLFLCMALSIDYTFFLLTRLQEERHQHDLKTSIKRMTQFSGSIVIVSGSILVVTWFALCFFPVFGINAVGYCSAIAVFMCMTTNLLLTPSLLCLFRGFFDRCGFSIVEDLRCCWSWRNDNTQARTYMRAPDNNNKPNKPNIYHKIASHVTTQPNSLLIPLAVYLLFAAGCYPLATFEFSIGAMTNFGSGPAADAYNQILTTFPSGVFATPFLILSSFPTDSYNDTGSILTEEVFVSSCEILKSVSGRVDGVLEASVDSIAVIGDSNASSGNSWRCLNVREATALLYNNTTTEESSLYRYKYQQLVNLETNRSTVSTFAVSFNPFSTKSRDVIKETRKILEEWNNKFENPEHSGLRFYLFHPIITEVDGEEFAISRFPWVLSLTLAIVFSLISIRFRAAFIPFKLVLTVIVPILFSFGVAVLVFDKGWLSWLNFDPLSQKGGLSWLVPCATVFLLLGLALDYDIFLFSRVYELRSEGKHNTKDCIINAVAATGPVISGAGIIMALAFLGMIVSTNEFLNEQGFIMILGVLIDTYIVRVVLVPSVLSLGGWLNWWPVKMPLVVQSTQSYP